MQHRRPRRTPAARNHAHFPPDRRRTQKQRGSQYQIFCAVFASVQAIYCAVVYRNVGRLAASACRAFPDAIARGLWYQYAQSQFRLSHFDCAGDAVCQSDGGGIYSVVDIAALGNAHQHFYRLGFPHQTHEVAAALLRYEDDWRHLAAHQRQQPHRKFFDRHGTQHTFFAREPRYFWRGARDVQRSDCDYLSHLHRFFNHLGGALSQKAQRTRLQTLYAFLRQSVAAYPTHYRNAGN